MSRLPLTLTLLLLSFPLLGQSDGQDGEEHQDGEHSKKEHKEQDSATIHDVIKWAVRVLAFFYSWIPWGIFFMLAFDGSIIPLKSFDEVFGSAGKVASFLDGMQVYIILPALLCVYMSIILWLYQFPPRIGWETFPAFCVLPRNWFGLLNIHQAPWLHYSHSHYAQSNFTLWVVAPTLLSCGRRTFVFSTFFSSFVGYSAYWCFGKNTSCVAGLSPVYCGWLGTLTVSCFVTCPPNWKRLLVTVIALAFVSYRFSVVWWEYDDDDSGENKLAYITGFVSGIIFGVMHFGTQRFNNKGKWGHYEGYEKMARKQGEPWPGVCAFAIRMVKLTCCCCCKPVDWNLKEYADKKAIEMSKF